MHEPAIMVHGGAGVVADDAHEAVRMGCAQAAAAAHAVLMAGGSAVDAVEAAVAALEDDPHFNAGTGAVLHRNGGIQLDASIMDGANLAAGAVAAVNRIKNPVRLARLVMEDARHVLLAGDGAIEFARAKNVPLCDEAELIVPRQLERWREIYGTVGCVARDAQGRCAAATSTGGRRGSLPGRVGDSPLIGCGTYADAHGAVSCTGIGEDIIRVGLARSAAERLRAGEAAADAVRHALEEFVRLTGSEAGLIAVDAQGALAHAYTTRHMAVAAIDSRGTAVFI